MRVKILALAAFFCSVVIGVADASAQTQTRASAPPAASGFGALQPRLHIDFGATPPHNEHRPSRSTPEATPPRFTLEARPPVDCNMPQQQADPTIDPKMVAPLPSAGPAGIITFFLRIVPVAPCSSSRP